MQTQICYPFSARQKGQESRYVTQLSQKVLLGTSGSFFICVPRRGSLEHMRDDRGRQLDGHDATLHMFAQMGESMGPVSTGQLCPAGPGWAP